MDHHCNTHATHRQEDPVVLQAGVQPEGASQLLNAPPPPRRVQLEAAIGVRRRTHAAGELPEPSTPLYDTPPPERQHRDLKAVSGA